MKSIIFILFSCAAVEALHVRAGKETQATKSDQTPYPTAHPTLKQWLTEGGCYNLVLTPQYNNQHSMFGITEYLRKENLLKKLGGIAAGSGGSLPGAFLAAGSNFSSFQANFPRKGWSGFRPSEPSLTQDYEQFLDATLPPTFGQLKYPLALSLTHWESTDALKKFDHSRQKGFAVNTGDLHEAMIAAVTTSGGHPSCPNCTKGFWPRRVNSRFPVTDGAFGDVWGVNGLSAIPSCNKLLHLLPLDYPGQVEPPDLNALPRKPAEMVSLVIVQPPVASHSYFHDKMPFMKFITSKGPEEWNALMFDTTHDAMQSAVDATLNFRTDTGGKQATLVLQHRKLTDHETFPEQVYDRMLALERDRFWAFYGDKDAWGDMFKAFQINQRLEARHRKRLLEDLASGSFGNHLPKVGLQALKD
jgi:hypothetical protein